MQIQINILSYLARFFLEFSQLWKRAQKRMKPPFKSYDTSRGLLFTLRSSIKQTSTAVNDVIRFNKVYGH